MLGERRLRALCIYLFIVAIRDNLQHTQTIMKLAKKRLPFQAITGGGRNINVVALYVGLRLETNSQYWYVL